MAQLTQKEKAEAFDKLLQKTGEYKSVRYACSELIGYYGSLNNYELVQFFTLLRHSS